MKNLDIEKLERKNIYKTPDNFFEKVQANVLMETVHKIKPEVQQKTISKTPQKQWLIAAAAAVALIFGLVFFLNNDKEVAPQIAQVEKTLLPAIPENTPTENAEQNGVVFENINEESTINSADRLTSVENKNQTATTPKLAVVENTKVKQTATAKVKKEDQVEQILAAFTSEDLAMISQNMEQDVYLDLYN